DPIAQIDAASAVTFANTAAISKKFTQANSADDVYIPTSVEVFLLHMIGPTPGLAALDKSKAGKGGDALDLGADSAPLTARYPDFLGVAGSAGMDAVLKLIETKFDASLTRAADLVSQNTPEDLPIVAAGGQEPPWLTIAKQEQAKGVAEQGNPP